MRIFKSLAEWQTHRLSLKGCIGFVPTMGNLHDGHLALYSRSVIDNDITVASIFVNPTQFNNADDFKQYPKTLEADFEALKSVGVDYCLLPNKADLYPDDYCYRVTENKLALTMEGACRPGHFDGVLSIVLKLLNLVGSDNAYFGKKDYQQYQLVKGMAQALFLKTQIIGCPIVRDDYGLALSSRNGRLSGEQLAKAREFAALFYQPLLSSVDIAKTLVNAGINVEYIKDIDGRRYAAVFIGDVRLIDNYSI